MKRIALVTLLLVVGCSQPDFRDTEGNGYRYEDYLGKHLVINYWAIWCGPCIKEIPELVALDENHEDIVVFGVNYDQPGPEMMAEQISDLKITFPVFDQDPRQSFGVDKPEVLPTTLIIGKDGELQDVLVGPQTEATLYDTITSLEAAPRIKASVEDLAWMSGSWIGPAFEQTLEENWIRPGSDTIACLVRLANGKSTSMVELILIEEEEQSLTLRVQQFGPGYKARMPEPLVMELVELEDRKARFKAISGGALKQLTYSRPAPDSFNVDVVNAQGESFTINLKAQE